MTKTLKEYYKDPDIILDEKNHWYLDKDGFIINLPSVSKVIEKIYPFDYSAIAPDLLKKGQEKGTCVHNRISVYIKQKIDIPCNHSVNTHNTEYEWLKRQIEPILETAKEYYSEVSLKNELFTGTFDFLYLDKDNQWHLIDFKTTKFLQPEKECLQLYLYSYLLSRNFIDEGLLTGSLEVFNTKNKKYYKFENDKLIPIAYIATELIKELIEKEKEKN